MLLVIAIIWAVVIGQAVMRARAEGSPADSIGTFRHQLYVLKRTAPHAVSAANSLSGRRQAQAPPAPTYRMARNYSPDTVRRARTLRRRRDVLLALMAAMAVTLFLAVLGFGAFWAVHVLMDLAFGGYVAMLVRMRNVAAERDMKLRFLPAPVQPEPALLLRRSAN